MGPDQASRLIRGELLHCLPPTDVVRHINIEKDGEKVDIKKFFNIVESASAIRRIQKMQPIGGQGDYIAPPTYHSDSGPIHVFETRRIGSNSVICVLLDSVQSQANRLEEAIMLLVNKGQIGVPRVEVDFSSEGLGGISTLEAPHRIFDAIIRDSVIRDSRGNGEDFSKSDMGRQINAATIRNALAIFEYSPTTLIFGGWNSTKLDGSIGARFQRCIVSEIVGINAAVDTYTDRTGRRIIVSAGRKPSSRLDPLQIEKDAIEIYKSKKDGVWSFDPGDDLKKSKPSEINHGNITPSMMELGTTVEYALQTTTITLAGLRRISLGDAPKDTTAHSVLASLALVAITELDRNGYSLRSRCDLVPESPSKFEIIKTDGSKEEMMIDFDVAKNLYLDAVRMARDAGLPWNEKPARLLPSKNLLKLVRASKR